jgi:hypothetical protein
VTDGEETGAGTHFCRLRADGSATPLEPENRTTRQLPLWVLAV